jgi:hypothetical protein
MIAANATSQVREVHSCYIVNQLLRRTVAKILVRPVSRFTIGMVFRPACDCAISVRAI